MRLVTALVVLTPLVGWAAYDVWVWSQWGSEHSITTVVRMVLHAHPLFPFLAGMVIGHLVWP